ncbi:hypothetical protein LIER_05738 [Lithospermum erythrorhizon]|uniref:Uncharacterized protein n=1 Tax=Lithospermum erythrorhizon TaxID=34254 RepID=A0AAV3P2X4_LITER
MGKKPDISKTYHKRSKPKDIPEQLEEPAEGWPVPLQIIPPISETEEEGMPMFDLDNARHQNPRPNDDVQPDSRPESNMHGLNYDDSTGNFQNPNPTFDTLAGSSRPKSSVERGEELFDEGVTPIVEETSDRGSKSLCGTDGVEIEDVAIATILDGLRKAKKGQLDADKLSVEADTGRKKRRFRKGIPNRFTGKGNVGEKSKSTKSQAEWQISDNEDVVFVGEKDGFGRKMTRASVAAAKEAVNEDTEIDLEELERSAEKKKAAKKGKAKVQGEIEKQRKKMGESSATRKTRSKIIPRDHSSSEAEDDPSTLRISKRESKGKLQENDDRTRIAGIVELMDCAKRFWVRIVREFVYCLHDNIDDPSHEAYQKLTLRGHSFTFSPSVINSDFRRCDSPTTGYSLKLSEIIKELTGNTIDKWPADGTQLAASSLSLKYSVLHKAALTCLVPDSNNTNVSHLMGRVLDVPEPEPVQAPTSETASLLINILEAEQRTLKDEIQAKQVRVAEIDDQLQSLKVPVPPVVTTEKTTTGPSTTPVSNAGSSDDVFVDVEEGIDEDLGTEES